MINATSFALGVLAGLIIGLAGIWLAHAAEQPIIDAMAEALAPFAAASLKDIKGPWRVFSIVQCMAAHQALKDAQASKIIQVEYDSQTE